MAQLIRRPEGARSLLPTGRAFGVFLLALYLFARYRDAFGIPFLNDDYVFLDHVSQKPFGALWGFQELAFHWWRPWSREFHYWWLQRAFGANEWPFHAASFVLGFGVLGAYWALARRVAGPSAAAIAVAGAATLPGWGLLMLWSAGAQDLWMLLLSLLALLAWRADRIGWAAAAYALALASKETAAPLPLLFIAHDYWVARRPWPETAMRIAPAVGVGLAWLVAHPLLLGRLWTHTPAAIAPSPAAVPPWKAVYLSVLSVLSLDRVPKPDGGWLAIWWDVLRSVFLLVLFVDLFARPDARPKDRLAATNTLRPRGAGSWALAWWACGTIPLLLPGLGWHAYYAQFAAMGAWLGLGRLLARPNPLTVGLIAVLGVLGAARAATPSEDWGEAAYQRRAGAYVREIRDKLLGAHPRMEPHARLWFVRLPNNVGFLAGNGPVVRVWYQDPTLQAGYYSAYTARTADEPAGPDHFFRMDEAGQFKEILQSAADDTSTTTVLADEQANPRFRTDRLSLATALAQGKDWRGAAAEFRALAIAFPDSSGFAFDAATAFMQAGDSAAAMQWFREAARRPDAPPEVVEAVRGMEPSPRTAGEGAPAAPKKAKHRSRAPTGNPREPVRAHEPGGPGR
ncbi:MAG TPA: glycosyltransferase family 39 protein [Methylomirabilota bacterium]|nr:glycosyltransferase family 39 protein [Methylomirabilota bacterium]